MSEGRAAVLRAEEPPPVPPSATGGTHGVHGDWKGPTYYGRPSLMEAPFNNWVVGGYVFLAGLAGASSILAAIAEATRPDEAAGAVRRGRYLPLLAPTLGAGLLVYDLHTPQRFYNMFRIAKGTSPMSIGTWILTGFSLFSGLSAALQFAADRLPFSLGTRGAAQLANVPAAVLGAGMCTYTGSLLAATSTPLWAAAPKALAVRFGTASIASGAAALSLGEESGPTRSALDTIAAAAVTAELVTDVVQALEYRSKGVSSALEGGWGVAEKVGATGVGAALPLGLHVLGAVTGSRGVSRLASLAILGGSLLLRVSIMAAGDKSARTPEISFRFAQPDNLPKRERRRLRRRGRALAPSASAQ